MNRTIFIKITAIVCFLTLISALLLLQKNPAKGYEFSIYSSTPISVWVLLILSVLGGISIVVYHIFNDDTTSRLWVVGLGVTMLSGLVVLSLPNLRGYAFTSHGGDVVVHVSYAKDIISYGQIMAYNIYPVTHIILATISLIAGVSVIKATAFPIVFYPLFVFSIYLLSSQVLNKKNTILATVTSALLLFPAFALVFPQGLSTFLIPVILFLFLAVPKARRNIIEYTILGIFMLCLIPFFHPSTALVLILILLLIQIAQIVFEIVSVRKNNEKLLTPAYFRRIGYRPSLICFIILMLWIWDHSYFWEANMKQVIQWFSGEMIVSRIAGQVTTNLSKLQLDIWGIINLGWKLYGYVLILLVLSTVGVIFVGKRFFSTGDIKYKHIFTIAVIFIVTCAIELQQDLRPMIGLSFGRFIDFALIITPLIIAFLMYEWVRRSKSFYTKIIKTILIVMILGIIWGNATLGLYSSPYTHLPNAQVTRAEFDGQAWLINYKDMKTQSLGGRWFPLAIMGYTQAEKSSSIWGNGPPDHFNYTEHSYFGESFNSDQYMPLSPFDRDIYTKLWPMIGRFSIEDYNRLEFDHTVSKPYTNGGEDVWLVHGIAGGT